MIIPPERLTEMALRGIVESYITREGTDYGQTELSLEEKVDQLMPKIITGEVIIMFDEDTDTVNLITRDDMRAANIA